MSKFVKSEIFPTKKNGLVHIFKHMLSKREIIRLSLVLLAQLFLSLLDLFSVALLGILGALTVGGIQSTKPSGISERIIAFFGIEKYSFQNQVGLLACASAFLLIIKTICSVYLTKRTLYFLSRRNAVFAGKLLSRVLNTNYLFIQDRDRQELIFAINDGTRHLTLGILGSTINVLTDLFLLLIMTVGLFYVSPLVALSSMFIFVGIGFTIYKIMKFKVVKMSQNLSSLEIYGTRKLFELFDAYREITIRDRKFRYLQEISRSKQEIAKFSAELSFLPNISKYVIETTLVIGILLISAIQFSMADAKSSIAVLTIFLAASTRIVPAILRVQQGILVIRSCIGSANPTLKLVTETLLLNELPEFEASYDRVHEGFEPNLEIDNLEFKYPSREKNAIDKVSLRMNSGESIAIVGSSGAGKSTLVDLILGMMEPDNGFIRISKLSPDEAVKRWPGAIAYVPQDIEIIEGTIYENVILGYRESEVERSQVNKVLKLVELFDFVDSLPSKLETHVGTSGSRLSGGQKQRLGIARALITNPKLLILDEATSALDGETEKKISDAIKRLQGEISMIIIAHRLSTIQNIKKIIYLDNGKIIAQGSFEELRNKVQDFDVQAKLMNL